ncbi:hypothetical protein JCM33374_g5223 [Metschnikowia sp. JCM 33374]|nr:hypothetical protein JCM33374_g5223 [Metschnikowia sp. JCM 33374]
MARLAIPMHSVGESSLKAHKAPSASQTVPKTSQPPSMKSTQGASKNLREYDEKEINSFSACIGQCEAKNTRLVKENAELTATVSHLRKTVSEYQTDLEKLRDENKRLRESMAVASVSPPNDFDRRLAEITSAVTHGLSHTLNALQSMSNGEQSSNTQTPEIPHVSNKDVICASPIQKTQPLARETLAITAGPGIPINAEMPLVVAKDLDTSEETNQKPVSSLVIKKQPQEKQEKNPLHSPRNDDKSVKVKLEEPGQLLPYKYVPGSFDSAVNTTKGKEMEDFDDITFFIKPKIKKRPSARMHDKSVNATLRKALPVKQEPGESLIKTEYSKTELSKNSHKEAPRIKVKRELSDENEHIVVKREPTKRRRALAPITKSSNNRPSTTISSDKKHQKKVFDFVDESTLLEQTRHSLKKAS